LITRCLHKSILFATLSVCFTIVFCSCDTKKTSTNVNTEVTINAPANLVATRNSATTVSLQWQDHSDNETGFRLERSLINVDSFFVVVAILPPNTLVYIDTTAIADRSYHYRVCAVVDSLHSAYSNVIFVLTVVLSAPSNLTAVRNDTISVTLNWQDNSIYEMGFQIERSSFSADTGFTTISTIPPNTTTFIDSTSSPNQVCYYHICAVLGQHNSGYSNVCAVPNFMLNAPGNFTAYHIDANDITLSWHDNATNETGFRIERSTADTVFTVIAITPRNTIMFTDTSVYNDRIYYYRICAVAGSYSSAFTSICAVPVMVLAPPNNLIAMWNGTSSSTLTWRDNSTNETGFRIERSSSRPDSGFFVVATVTQNVNLYTDNSVIADRTQYYRICAIAGTLSSSYSNVYTLPRIQVTPPSNFSINRLDFNRVALQWQDNTSNETGFQIERSTTNSDSGFIIIRTVPANSTSYTDSTGFGNYINYYRICTVVGAIH